MVAAATDQDGSAPEPTEAKTTRAAEKIAREFASVLLHARLPEGTLLSPEADLTKAFGCSRTALRGALRLVESWGLITVHPGRNGGPVVRHPQARDLRPGLAALIHSRRASLAELFTARAAIEPVIAAEAARRRSDAQLAEMKAIITTGYEGIGSRDVFVRVHSRFHEVLAESAGATLLGAFLTALAAIADETVQRITPNDEVRRLRVLRADERIVEAIAASDPEAAEAAMSAYLTVAEDFYRRFAPTLLESPLRPLAFLEP